MTNKQSGTAEDYVAFVFASLDAAGEGFFVTNDSVSYKMPKWQKGEMK